MDAKWLWLLATLSFVAQINSNGPIALDSCDTRSTPSRFGSSIQTTSRIAIFWDDIRIISPGILYHRITENSTLLHRASMLINEWLQRNNLQPTFSAEWLLISTWQNVEHYDALIIKVILSLSLPSQEPYHNIFVTALCEVEFGSTMANFTYGHSVRVAAVQPTPSPCPVLFLLLHKIFSTLWVKSQNAS